MMRKKQIYVSLSVMLFILLILYGYTKYTDIFPSTDDAYVQANTVNIAPQVSGPVKSIYAYDHQFVSRGQLLFEIDPNPFEIAVEKAQANFKQTQAELSTQQKDTARTLSLVKQGQAPKSEGDDAQGKLDQLTAALKVAKSTLDGAQLDLEHTHIYAPADGNLTNFVLRVGQVVQSGAYLFALVENKQFWVDANFKETDLNRVKPGQSAKIKIDMHPDVIFQGIVQGISAGSGAIFSVLPPENATGNWVKVTQRFPVRVNIINPDPKYPLRAGSSCEVTIDTREQ